MNKLGVKEEALLRAHCDHTLYSLIEACYPLQFSTFGILHEAKNVKVLQTPSEFYTYLIQGVQSAHKRICFSSLYLGTGPLERHLVHALHQACQAHPETLQVTILLDGIRGRRGQHHSFSLLEELKRTFPKNVTLLSYVTPQHRGLSSCLPERWNEVVGLQHMKYYAFDDDVLISGANLSETYFTDRQDRYVIIKDAPVLVDYYTSLSSLVGNLTSEPQTKIRAFFDTYSPERILFSTGGTEPSFVADTILYPTVQLPPYHVRQDEVFTSTCFQFAQYNKWHLTLATAYFNLYRDFKILLGQHRSQVHLIAPSARVTSCL